MQRLRTLYLIIHMLLGGKCKYGSQKYLVVYSKGNFIIEGTGTLIGNIHRLEKYDGNT